MMADCRRSIPQHTLDRKKTVARRADWFGLLDTLDAKYARRWPKEIPYRLVHTNMVWETTNALVGSKERPTYY